MAAIEYARGRNLRDINPVARRAGSLREFADQLEADRSKTKSTAPYICAPMSGRRRAESALPRSWLPVDADRIDRAALTRWDRLIGRFSGLQWATHSSTRDEPRRRAIILLDKVATRDECIAAGASFAELVAVELGDAVELDPCVYRPEQPVLAPPMYSQVEILGGDSWPVRHNSTAGGQQQLRLQSSSVSPQCASVLLLCSSVGEAAFEPDEIPAGVGQRNRCLWQLAQRLKAQKANATYEDVRAVAVAWHAAFNDVIGTKSLTVTIDDLWRMYEKVRWTKGGVMSDALLHANSVVLPDPVDRLGYGEHERRLLKVCIALAAQQQPGEPFFISVRVAGREAGLDYSDAAKVLRVMERDGLLELVTKGAGKVASRYRLGPLLGGR
ncbi:hypothetical protein [Azohydromonas sp.]|uniref:hypothetical protein n=1 Tax=Azohydromonas sp. TaxID=1872666 RepID=UPI002C457E2A|nr:hypothetical protein [Azohydromonas sp.]HMM85783.1 hypothetical protein [Azohydromonas sp.]